MHSNDVIVIFSFSLFAFFDHPLAGCPAGNGYIQANEDKVGRGRFQPCRHQGHFVLPGGQQGLRADDAGDIRLHHRGTTQALSGSRWETQPRLREELVVSNSFRFELNKERPHTLEKATLRCFCDALHLNTFLIAAMNACERREEK